MGKWKLIWGYPEGLRSNVSRKATRAAFAQNLGEANNLDLLHLYNLEKDPNETVNLATVNRHTRKTLMKKVRKIMRSGEVVKPDTPFLRKKSLPVNFGGVVSPGWCVPRKCGALEAGGVGLRLNRWTLETAPPPTMECRHICHSSVIAQTKPHRF